MKIVVCFKIVPDFERVLSKDFEDFSPNADLSYAGRIINCFDETALELALRIKDARPDGDGVECTALTVGRDLPLSIAKTLFAAGFDGVELLQSDDGGYAPLCVAERIAGRVREISPDLIFTGKQAGFADGGTTAFYIAEALGLPAIGEASDASFCGGVLSVELSNELFAAKAAIEPPCVISVGNSPIAGLRISSLKRRLEVSGRDIRILRGAEYSNISRFSEIKFQREKKERQCKLYDDVSQFASLLKKLYDGEKSRDNYMTERP
ncbi:MAG: hypothetical protein LBQ40_06025 [Clostridiales bacterium]|jgi:electron transfer flavoprotein beta subunit|nr:hypothetical protein [Clostridiales bacterium]